MPSKKANPPQIRVVAGLARPAQRALAGAAITRLEQLAKKTEAEIAGLHGMGPNAMATLKRALKAKGLTFSKSKSN